MSERSFAGIRYRDRLYAGYYGRLFRAETVAGQPVRLLEVDETLARAEGFAAALTGRGGDLARLEHPHVVGTRIIGRAPDGNLVIVTDEVEGCALDELLGMIESAGRRGLPVALATAIASQMLQGLIGAHARGIVHGALHPRSIIIGTGGQVHVDHFAVGWALAEASARDGTPTLFRGFSGFLAPELAVGEAPGEATDVYAAGAVLFAMLTGWAPPRELQVSPALKSAVLRALDTDRAQRYASAGALLEALDQALAEDGWTVASPADLADYVRRARTRPDTDPGRASDSMLMPPARPDTDPDRASQSMRMSLVRLSSPGPAAASGVDAVLAALDAEPDEPAPSIRDSSHAALAALASLDLEDDEDAGGGTSAGPADRDSAAALPEGPESRPPTTLPMPSLHEPGPAGRDSATELPGGPESRPPTTLPMPSLHEPGPAGRDSATELPGGPESRPPTTLSMSSTLGPEVGPQPEIPDERSMPGVPALAGDGPIAGTLDTPALGKRRMSPVFWGLVAVLALGVLVWAVRNQAMLRDRAEERAEQAQAAQEEVLRRMRESQPRLGQIRVESTPDQAAVWMLLGRTPLDTMPLSASMLHELRLEFEGHQPLDLRVEGSHWSGTGDALRASLAGTLVPGVPERPMPAAPPEPPPEASAGLTREGQGPIHVTSTPSGAQVWLLVGFTPDVAVSVEAGQGYELKLLKDGHLPGFVVIRADDWGSPGDAPEGVLTRSVELKRRKR